MEPPRPRRPRATLSPVRLAMLAVLNLGALATALLSVRPVITAVGQPPPGVPQAVARVPDPLAWLLERAPALGHAAIGPVPLPQVVAPVALALIGLILLGILAGWEAEARR